MARKKDTERGDVLEMVVPSSAENYAQLNKLIIQKCEEGLSRYLKDMDLGNSWRSFRKYSKVQVAEFLENPFLYEKELREAVIYIYNVSPHFRRLIQYFVGLNDLSFVVSPYRIDPKKANIETVNRNYRKVLNELSIMNIRTQFPDIMTICFREDIFFGTIWESSDNIIIQRLPSEYCRISSIEGNVFNVAFNMAFFIGRECLLSNYPAEFREKYEATQNGGVSSRWVELDSPTSFAVKCNSDIPHRAIPPFAGILREIYDIEDYKDLKLTKTAIDNYAILLMKIPLADDGAWKIDFNKARDFWSNLDAIVPDEIGTVLSPMDIEKISFEKSRSDDNDTITEAEQNLFTAAGVSSLLFNNAKASANALLLSIKADQSVTYGLVKQLENVINRFIQSKSYGKYFKVTFLDSSPFNRKELGDSYLKAASYGLPTISMYAASQGLCQSELDSMSFLEGTVLGLQDMFKPLISSSQLSSDDLNSNAATDEGGAPRKDIGEITESGEQNQEDA